MIGFILLALSAAVIVLLGPELLIALQIFVSLASAVFPFGLIAMAVAGLALTWRTLHRPEHWGRPE